MKLLPLICKKHSADDAAFFVFSYKHGPSFFPYLLYILKKFSSLISDWLLIRTTNYPRPIFIFVYRFCRFVRFLSLFSVFFVFSVF